MRRAFWRAILVTFLSLTLLVGIVGWRFYKNLESEVTTRFSHHQWDMPSKLYVAPTPLYPGVDIAEMGLLDLLNRLDYRSTSQSVQSSGEYFYAPSHKALQLFLHDSPAPSDFQRRSRRINIDLAEERIEKLTDLDDGSELWSVEVDPEVITSLYDQSWEERRDVKL